MNKKPALLVVSCCALVVAVALGFVGCHTQQGPWTKLEPAGDTPTPRCFHSMIYDSSSGKIILFGGSTRELGQGTYRGEFVTRYLDDTWAYDPAANTWTELKAEGEVPTARSGHSMAYDPISSRVILFGGRDSNVGYVNDTWAYNPASNTWAELKPTGDLPPPRAYHAIAYDPTTATVILFGGLRGSQSRPENFLGDTWAYDPGANTWTELKPFGEVPMARRGHSMVYDPTTGRIVLFGGEPSGDDYYWYYEKSNETWAYDSAANVWTLLVEGIELYKEDLEPRPSVPLERHGHSLVYDPARRSIILLGGSFFGAYGLCPMKPGAWVYPAEAYPEDVWTYDPATNTWTQIYFGGHTPRAREFAPMVFDPSSGKVILFGGYDPTVNPNWPKTNPYPDAYSDETWTFDPTFKE